MKLKKELPDNVIKCLDNLLTEAKYITQPDKDILQKKYVSMTERYEDKGFNVVPLYLMYLEYLWDN